MTYRDEALVVLDGDPSVLMEIHEDLSFESPGAKYDPRVRKGHWDGRIHLLDRRKGTLYAGLAPKVAEWCRAKGVALEEVGRPERKGTWTVEETEFFISTLAMPERFETRDYQVAAFREAMNEERRLFVSPTSSGKSMIIYWITRALPHRTLIVVPTVGLVHQMVGDFQDYGSTQEIHKIQDGRDIPPWTDVVVATWQSIYEQPPEWFDQFGVVIGDEAHLFKAKSLVTIMTNLTRCRYRFGFTGTLDGSKVHQLILEGLFGPTTHVTTTTRLMEQGYVAQLKVEVVALQHPREGRNALELKTSLALEENAKNGNKQKRGAVIYRTEIDHIYGDERRNRFIVKMASRLPGNVLLLFHHLSHGDALYDMMVAATDRPVHLINGGVDGLERDEIRALVDASEDAILIASVGTSATGINIRRINNLVMASPWKSRIVNLQSIGRGLRLADGKTSVTVYDVADSLSNSPLQAPNTTLRHLAERVAIYEAEGFDFRVTRVEL